MVAEAQLNKSTLDLTSPAQRAVDRIGLCLFTSPDCVLELPTVHRFTPHLYIREVLMRAGMMVISRIHKFTHPFVISCGDVSVWTENEGIKRYIAPYTGITYPGTRRVLRMHSDTIWTTFHVTDLTDPDEIVAAMTEPQESPQDKYGGKTYSEIMEGLK